MRRWNGSTGSRFCWWAVVSVDVFAELSHVKFKFFEPFGIVKPHWNRVLVEDQQALMQSHVEVAHSVGSLHLQPKPCRREAGVSDPVLEVRPITVDSHRSPGVFQTFQRLFSVLLKLQDASARESVQVCHHIVASGITSRCSSSGVAAAVRDDDLCVRQCFLCDCDLICNSITMKHLVPIPSQFEGIAGGVNLRIDVMLRPEIVIVTQYWIKSVLFQGARTIPFHCFLDWFHLFFQGMLSFSAHVVGRGNCWCVVPSRFP